MSLHEVLVDVTPRERRLIERAARAAGLSVSRWCLQTLMESAERTDVMRRLTPDANQSALGRPNRLAR